MSKTRYRKRRRTRSGTRSGRRRSLSEPALRFGHRTATRCRRVSATDRRVCRTAVRRHTHTHTVTCTHGRAQKRTRKHAQVQKPLRVRLGYAGVYIC